ncbi:aminotransferase class IV family protein [Streptosporangium saharense]|uniref:aminotransferase class IV family protein n=1 Tax=Streptosporangium saharense TaxID=1706840 RepID=UPI0036C53D1A
MSQCRPSAEPSLHFGASDRHRWCKNRDMAELNGAPVPPEAWQALSLVNYGHFTSMRVHEQHIRGLSHHLERLAQDCRLLFAADLDRDYVRDLIRHAIKGDNGTFVARVTVFDPQGDLGHPGASSRPSILVTTRPAPSWPAAPMRVQTACYHRELPKVKHVGLLGSLWHRRQAQSRGYDDALFVDNASFISEGATWNIGFFDGDRIIWPDADMLPGVTMRLLRQVHDDSISTPLNTRDVPAMQAAFATNTAVGVRPISTIDGTSLDDTHPIFTTLQKEYAEIPPERL